MRFLGWLFGLIFAAGILLAICVVAFDVRVFVIQPIGALPEGGSVILYGRPKLQLVDSPDAICMRTTGAVTLFCRAAALGVVGDGSTILLRMPYADWLYALSGAPSTTR